MDTTDNRSYVKLAAAGVLSLLMTQTAFGQDSAKELSQKTADPTGEYAMVFTQFGLTFNDGDANTGDDAKVAGNIVFQPIIPIPLYGTGDNEWRIVSRPTIALQIEDPIPQGGINNFDRKTDLSDLNIPLPVAPPKSMTGRWIMALGPDFSIPTATQDEFGRQQWSAGVTGVIGYKGENWMAGAYPQYYWGVADQGRDDDVKDASFGNMFYWFWYNITDSFQVGFSPTIQYDHQADSGNRWNVPVGLGFSKIIKMGQTPIRIEIGAEYSVVHEDDFGTEMLFKVNFIPVIPRPIQKALFGGG
jgi:hypothetical protein